MPNTVITVENLSKRFSISHRRPKNDGLRHVLQDKLTGRWRQLAREEFWALRNVNLEIKQGEIVGIIGRNGAGKSTLLKILSRITEPTVGRIHLKGRVSSLLEVGTGFHPELTGQENIYLNGAILGMTTAEITRKFDQIVDFAEVEMFLDVPIKRYSSGMAVRLAFSIAAHLEPEILIVDEVLAVGDSKFQDKCIGRMNSVARAGRTVLFVSHNTNAVRNLCTRGLVLSHGQVVQDCHASAAVDFYIHSNRKKESALQPHIAFNCPNSNSDFAITRIETRDLEDNPMPIIETSDHFVLRITFQAPRPVARGAIDLLFSTIEGTCCFHISTQPDGTYPLDIRAGEQVIECVFRDCPLAAGRYRVGVGIALPNVQWLFFDDNLTEITVHPKDIYGSGMPPSHPRSMIAVKHHWRSADASSIPSAYTQVSR
jgi:lipopolysaccharide transport system ATP-binding protein